MATSAWSRGLPHSLVAVDLPRPNGCSQGRAFCFNIFGCWGGGFADCGRPRSASRDDVEVPRGYPRAERTGPLVHASRAVERRPLVQHEIAGLTRFRRFVAGLELFLADPVQGRHVAETSRSVRAGARAVMRAGRPEQRVLVRGREALSSSDRRPKPAASPVVIDGRSSLARFLSC
jgi:hypothetical protein